MWRLANCIYRTFRNVATHRYPQDIVVPVTNIHNQDDDESNKNEKQDHSIKHTFEFDHAIEYTRFSFENFKKLQKSLHKNLLQQLVLKFNFIELSKTNVKHETQTSSNKKDETFNGSLQADENYTAALKSLSELHEETISLINNQSAIEAFEEGNVQLGIETLQLSAKDGNNAAALYNLGICFEQGIGVEIDRMKACDYYRQAASLGHVNAFINLTLLSNHIDTDNDDECEEQTITNRKQLPKCQFSFSKNNDDNLSLLWNDYTLDLSKTLTYLS